MGGGKKKRESKSSSPAKKAKNSSDDDETRFVGNPIPTDEAKQKWPRRYQSKSKVKIVAASSNGSESNEDEVLQARFHYTKAIVDGVSFSLFDDAYIKAEEGKRDYIAKIVEMFQTTDKQLYFTARWFFRAEDTVIKEQAYLIDERRVFLSDMMDDNPLDSILSKVKIVQLAANVELAEKEETMKSSDLYFDMVYSLPYFSFSAIETENPKTESDESSTISSESCSGNTLQNNDLDAGKCPEDRQESEMTVLDLYSGCGAMSTGLCFGASISGLKLVTRWAVDINPHACQSLKLNHPETEVRNEKAEDFLCLLVEWEKLCKEFNLLGQGDVDSNPNSSDNTEDEDAGDDSVVLPGEFEVWRLLAVCYGDPNKVARHGLHFKVRWKGYGSSEDTWEPIDGLSKCKDKLGEFVSRGYKSKILPLPGDVDFICGGPPCQGISGFNRFRNKDNPLEDPKNHQLVVFMDIVGFLKPKYILMENVADIFKFAKGALGCYAVGRLVSMNYQARVGILAAGSYGVPQCRMRVFLWGAHKMKNLPQFPLPTHEVVKKGVVLNEFKDIVVGNDEKQSCKLEKSTLLGDAISDMPAVSNYEVQDEMPYGFAPRTDFQKYIRLKRQDLFGSTFVGQNASQKKMLYDHRSLQLNEDDYGRVCQIPKHKGANFRDLPGVFVGPDNVVQWDPAMERLKLPSGKPLAFWSLGHG